ncbi:MAG TPA: ABC transporter ATP-binding protein, partial [Clostridiaceae bacterium]|nr:ABC transporter ATP-binding protein [Clostridiaceae bacterium]
LCVLIGPSGCGKTTSLKMINKLIKPTSGTIYIDGKDISKEDTIELRRNIGYVIQQTGLFPHMTVGENIAIVPKMKKWEEAKIKERTLELLKMVGMNGEEYLDRYPTELSGGQQQRIGVARAMAVNPDIILMDEPFSALDPITRSQLQDELYGLQQEMKKTIIFVTHDMDEALKLGDRICIMKDGDIVQYDTPENILKNPHQGFVEEFIGKNRIWDKPEFITAADIMIKDPVKAAGTRTIVQALEIMKSSKVDSLLITDREGKLQGLVTLKDIQKKHKDSVRMMDILETTVISVKEDDSIIDVLRTMNDHQVGYVPVTDNLGVLKGLITRSSLLTILSGQYLSDEEDNR